MNQENLIPVYGNATFKRDPNTGALLNCNYDKLEISKTIINLNTKYIELDNKINTIDCLFFREQFYFQSFCLFTE